MVKRIGKSLGKGIDFSSAVHKGTESDVDQNENRDSFSYLSVHVLEPGKYQPRTTFDEEPLEDLADSIRSSGGGMIEPIVVRPMRNGRYEIIAGERRWRAACLIDLEEVPCVIKSSLSDKDALKISLVENIHRENLKPLEEAEGFLRLNVEFGLSHADIGNIVGRSRSSVSNLLRLLELSPACKAALNKNQIEVGHARAMLSLSHGAQKTLLDECIAKKLTVRAVERRVASILKQGELVEEVGQDSSGIDSDLLAIEQQFFRENNSLIHIKALGSGEVTVRFKSLDVVRKLLEQ